MFSPNDPNKAIEVKITIIREPSSGNMYAVNNLRSMLSDEELSKQIAKAEALAGKSRTKALGHLMDKIAGISINPYSGLFYHGQHHTGTSYKDHTDIFIRKEVGTSNLIVALSSDGHESYELLGMMQ